MPRKRPAKIEQEKEDAARAAEAVPLCRFEELAERENRLRREKAARQKTAPGKVTGE